MIRDFLRVIFVVNLIFGSIAIEEIDEKGIESSKLVLINHANEPIDLFWVQSEESLMKLTLHPLRNGTNTWASLLYLKLLDLTIDTKI